MRHVLFGAMVFLSAASANAGAPDYFTELTRDFGTTPRGPVLTHYFIVTNTTKQVVTIGQPRVSCGCVSANMLKNVLQPGESTAVVAAMDTRRIPQAGVTRTVTIYVPFLNPVMEEVALKVLAIARDDLVISANDLAFGTVRQGKGGTATVKVTLFNNAAWQVSEVTSSGLYVKAEAKESKRLGNEVSYDVTATLDPSCPVGNWTADVWLKTNASGVEKLRVPVTVNVTTPIAVSPEAVRMPDLKVGEESTTKIILQGSQAFKVLEVKGLDGIYSIKSGTEESRPVHILTIAVKPKEAGAMMKTFEILTDHKEKPSVTVPFSGTAK